MFNLLVIQCSVLTNIYMTYNGVLVILPVVVLLFINCILEDGGKKVILQMEVLFYYPFRNFCI